MCNSILPDESAHSKARRESCVLVFVPTYMNDLRVYELAFPKAKRVYTALFKHTQDISVVPKLTLTSTETLIPLISSHLRLIKDYWSVSPRWPAWCWIESELSLLKRQIFNFKDGCIDKYKQAILKAASCIKDFIKNLLAEHKNSAVCIYGRGHWTMNAVAIAAEEYSRTLYVIERGILPDTYILDINLPYSAPGSTFRTDWDALRTSLLKSNNKSHNIFRAASWDVYIPGEFPLAQIETLNKDKSTNLCILIGQCFFDYNLRFAPYDTQQSFIEYCFLKCSDILHRSKTILYRPHPLSPEIYPNGNITTIHGNLRVVRGNPCDLLSLKPLAITWNSTLGLEAWLFYNCSVVTLAPNCFYKTLLGGDERTRNGYLSFLNKRSIYLESRPSKEAEYAP
jgi:hypothetical protein